MSLSTNSNALNKKRSFVWYHFTPLENSQAKCNICSEKKCFTGGSTGNLLRHLKTKHPTVPLEKSQVKYQYQLYLFVHSMSKLYILNYI